MPDLAELRERVAWLAGGSPRPREVFGMKVFSTTRTTAPLGSVAEPVVSLVAQGAKRSVLGHRAFDYTAGQFLVITVDLPLTSHITAARDAEPFVGCSLPLDPAVIAQLLLESRLPAQAAPPGPAIAVSDATPDLIDAFVRLLRLAGSPRDAQVLAPAVRREVHWRLLANPGDVAGAGHAVGYASASQFNREYRRMFGVPPGQDAARLQGSRLVAE